MNQYTYTISNYQIYLSGSFYYYLINYVLRMRFIANLGLIISDFI